VTTSPPGTAQGAAGVLGQPGTSVLVGDSRVNRDGRSGGRFDLGYWVDSCRTWAVEGNFLFLDHDERRFVNGSDGTQIIARPFRDALTGLQASQLISFPGLLAGTASVHATANNIYGAEGLVRRSLWSAPDCDCGRGFRADLLAGYRYFQLDEGLQVREDLTSIDVTGLVPVGSQITILDSFRTRNQFHGGEVGVATEWRSGSWSLDLLAKLALGNNRQEVVIDGATRTTVPGGGSSLATGGLLAQVSNVGTYHRDEFTLIPELRVTVGYQVGRHVRLLGGYTFLYWTNVVRPGDQVDLTVNPNLIPPTNLVGPSRPAFSFHGSDFWAQGLQGGLEFSF